MRWNTHLSNELNNLHKYIERCVTRNHTTWAFWEKCWHYAHKTTTGKKKISHNETMKLTEHSQTILPILHTMSGEFIFSHRVFVMFTKIPLAWYVSATFYLKFTRKQRHSPLSYSVAFTFYSNYINPQQSVQRFQCNSRHFRIFILFRTKENSSKFI